MITSRALKGIHCLYIIQIDENYCKFGISRVIHDRIQTHKRFFDFKRIYAIFACRSENHSLMMENKIKSLAKLDGILTKYRGETEIIYTQDPSIIEKYFVEYLDKFQDTMENQNLLDQYVELFNSGAIIPESKASAKRRAIRNNIITCCEDDYYAVAQNASCATTSDPSPDVYLPRGENILLGFP